MTPKDLLPDGHPQRRKKDPDAGFTEDYPGDGRHPLRMPNARPVTFTRPIGVLEARDRAAALRRVNATGRWHRARVAGWRIVLYAGLGLVVASVGIVTHWWGLW